jgi:hypothetical protein
MRNLLLSVLAICITVPSAFAQQLINFDELTTTGPGQGGQLKVFSQYAARGVTFNGPVALDYSKGLAIPGFAHSGTIAIEQCYSEEFCSTPIQMDFTTGQARVRLWVGSSQRLSVTRVVLVRAFDSSGTVVGTVRAVLAQSTGAVPIRSPVEFQLATPAIRRVTVSYDPPTLFTNGLAIDDVEFSTEGPPPPCLAAGVPLITLKQPGNAQVQRNKFQLEGSIDARGGTLASAAISVTGASGAMKTLNLLGGLIKPEGGPFGAVWIHDMLFPGANTVRLATANCKGSSQAVRTVTYAPISPAARFQLLHLEVTQATQTMLGSVVLIARKPTVVRAYLRITGQATPVLRVGGVLTAVRPDGSRPPGPAGVAAIRTVAVDTSADVAARRLDLQSSLNFRLPKEWLAAGRLHFEIARLEIDGDHSTLPCDGCENNDSHGFPALVSFKASRRLNLVLAPHIYEPPSGGPSRTPDLLLTPSGALQWVNNVFPLPGSFPQDELGINLIAILPFRTTDRNLNKREQQLAFLDDLDAVRDAWLAANPGQPSDTRFLGIVPCGCGGRGRLPGYVALADTGAIEDGAPTSFGGKGKVWAHELGHNFGRKHSSSEHDEKNTDKQFPYAHGGIGEPGLAIITEWWNGSPYVIRPETTTSHAHDFMNYGGRPWTSPYTFEALHRKFLPSTSIAGAPVERVLVAGTVSPDTTVTLRAAYRETTTATSGDGRSGEFTVKLLDGTGRVLQSHRFDAVETSDGEDDTRTFSEFVPWRAGTRRLVVEREGVALARRQVSPNAPEVTILSPRTGDFSGDHVVISWTGADRDGDALTYTVLVDAGNRTWLPVATDLRVTSHTLDTTLLPGTTRARVRVRASDGVNSSDVMSGTFTIPPKPPMVAMTRIATPGGDYLFGVGYDPGVGYLAADALTWSSDREGVLGHGNAIPLERLSPGSHQVTLRVKTRNQEERAEALRVEVAPRSPVQR